MKLNPYISLIQNNNKFLLYYKIPKKYYEIDKTSYDFLNQAKDIEVTRTDENFEIFDFYCDKEILVDSSFPCKISNPEKKIFSITHVYICSFDINNFLDRHYKITSFLIADKMFNFMKITYIISCLLSILTLGLIANFVIDYINNIENSTYIINNFQISIMQMAIVYVGVFLMNVFHEIGHIFQCKKYTGHVGNCGIMLFFLMPVLYTDITSSSTVSKKIKIKIILAGINNQILLSGFFSIILIIQTFIFKQQSVLIIIFFLINFIIIISNLNPFYKFDGYWYIKTKIDIDNLYTKAIDRVFRPHKLNISLIHKKSLFNSLCY